MSVTLSIPPTIVEEIRVWANSAGTSLNQYIRDCLEAKAHEIRESRQREAKEFFSLRSPQFLPQVEQSCVQSSQFPL